VSDGTALLLSWLRFGKTPLEARLIPRALEALARLDADLVVHSAASQPDEVLDMLHMVASVVQVELPETLGLTAYVALLQPLPPHVLKAAALEILNTHVYRTMPLPGEFIASDAAREWKQTSTSMRKLIAHWQAELLQRAG
jgi:hypothetical protein